MDFTTSPWPPEAQNLTGKVQIKPNYDAQKFPLAGGYADVWPGVWKVDGQTPRNVAIKAPRLPHILEITSEKLTTRQKRELGSWAAVEHKNILPFLGYCTDLNPYICLVSPWMSNGTAIDYVKTRPDVDRVQMIIGVAEGLDFLHSKNIVHGDVRGGNILISDNGEPLLADFGLSRHIHDMPASTKPKGTLRWEAPELQDPEEYGLDAQPAHALPIDVWSFGMTVLEIMTGTHPYSELNDGALIIAVRKRQIPQKPKSGVTALDKLWPICLQCWVFWPNSRPTMDETVRTLRRLTVDDAATTLQLHLDDAVNSVHKLAGQMDAITQLWMDRLQLAHRVTFVLLSALLLSLFESYWFRGKSAKVLFSPWLAGCLTWYWLQLFSFETSDSIFKFMWTVLRRGAWMYFVTLVSSIIVFAMRIGR